MANSTCISELKNHVMDMIIHNNALFQAFDAKECETGSDLKGTHLFTYNKIPDTAAEPATYMTIIVNIKEQEKNRTFITPTLEIWIYSHYKHMSMDKEITDDNRNDYISMLLDKMFNGSDTLGGIGNLTLILNEEGKSDKEFLHRHLIFQTTDINNSLCESW